MYVETNFTFGAVSWHPAGVPLLDPLLAKVKRLQSCLTCQCILAIAQKLIKNGFHDMRHLKADKTETVSYFM